MKGVGGDVWDVEGYKKAILDEFLLVGKLEPYKNNPPQAIQLFSSMLY